MGEDVELTQEQKDYIKEMQHLTKAEQEIEVKKNIIEDIRISLNAPNDWHIYLRTPRVMRGGIRYLIQPREKFMIVKISNMTNQYFLVYLKYRDKFVKECNEAIAKAGGW